MKRLETQKFKNEVKEIAERKQNYFNPAILQRVIGYLRKAKKQHLVVDCRLVEKTIKPLGVQMSINSNNEITLKCEDAVLIIA